MKYAISHLLLLGAALFVLGCENQITGNGIQHVRNQIYASPVEGDLAGTSIVEFNADIDLATGNGNAHGSFSFSGDCIPCSSSGDFEGNALGKFESWVFTGSFVGQGSGGFDGLKIKGAFAQDLNRLPELILNYTASIK
jgi:hypothetical protein